MTEIVTPVPITPMPAAPLLTDTQSVFNTKAFAFVAAWDAFVAQMNAVAAATRTNAVAGDERAVSANTSSVSAASSAAAAGSARDMAQAFAQSAVNAPGTSGTSISAVAIGVGPKTMATQAGKAWVPGQTITVAAAAAPTTQRMVGIITSYDSATGALAFDVPASAFQGSGSPSSWVISLGAARDGVVRLGAGPGQLGNSVEIGWSGTNLKASVGGVVDLGNIAFEPLVTQAAPPGMRGEFYAVAPPAGWLKANGAAVSRTTYAALFSVIGTYYGAGDGVSTFNLPDDRGLFSRAYDDGRGVDPGRVFGSEQASQNIAHGHVATDTGHIHGTYDPGHGHVGSTNTTGGHNHGGQQIPLVGSDVDRGTVSSSFSLDAGQNIPTDGAHAHTVTANPNITNLSVTTGAANIVVNSSGGSEARPINRAVLVCIKY